ncbi:hypothetical protein, partial [uncultured Oscillibacter sp.]|uniref:hypothetical protein n=1 Tax=uncultured Oscillibacter sp. TaxID=876091 RepID=UPI0026333BDE
PASNRLARQKNLLQSGIPPVLKQTLTTEDSGPPSWAVRFSLSAKLFEEIFPPTPLYLLTTARVCAIV